MTQTKDPRYRDSFDVYMRGRADERASIIGWLKAEAEDEPLPSYKNAFIMMYTALQNIAPDSEMHGLSVRPIDRVISGDVNPH